MYKRLRSKRSEITRGCDHINIRIRYHLQSSGVSCQHKYPDLSRIRDFPIKYPRALAVNSRSQLAVKGDDNKNDTDRLDIIV